MSGQVPNSSNIERVGAGAASETGIVVHPEYQYWRPDWMKLRDVIAGQREVKSAGTFYLPKMPGMDQDAYDAYLMRATFYNMTAQTQNGMLGQVFRRDPIIRTLPPKFKDAIRVRFAKDGTGHVNFTKTVMGEQIAMGRCGVLVDAPATPSLEPSSYTVCYSAENILDWTIDEVDGFFQPTRILLREFVRSQGPINRSDNPWLNDPNSLANKKARARNSKRTETPRPGAVKGGQAMVAPIRYMDAYTYTTKYRELLLTQQDDGTWVYTQNVYTDAGMGSTPMTFTPTIRGTPLSFIPFKFFGSMSNSADVERSPILDIADLNLSHYRTYAELEHGRKFTGLPIYYAPGTDSEGAPVYHLGPDTVWEVPSGEKPGLLEFTGQGLGALERALDTKEAQIAAIGGRMLPGQNKASENANQTTLREANEQSVLLNVILCAQTGMSEVVRWWLMFRDVPLAQSVTIDYQINQDFLSTPIGAREIRAIQLMYVDGLIAVDQLYNYLQKAQIIDADMTLDEFKILLRDPNSFLNAPDASARQRGFADRKQELDQANVAREADFQQQEIDLQAREVKLMEQAPPATIKPPAPPSPAGAALPARAGGPVPPKPGSSAGKVAAAPSKTSTVSTK